MTDTAHLTPPQARLLAAEANAAAARARLTSTIGLLQGRLAPRVLARDALDAGQTAANAASHVAKRNPGTLAGATALAGLFLARHRVFALLRRPRATADAPRELTDQDQP